MPGWEEGESPAVPDLAGTVRCYKDMGLILQGDTLTPVGLRSLSFNITWDAGVQTAGCNRYRSAVACGCGLCKAALQATVPLHDTPAPAQHCGCGFYAWHRPNPPQAARNLYASGARALAVCEASGVIIPHQLGLRAQHMQVVAFQLLEGRGRWLRLDFGIPQFFTAEEMLEAYPPSDTIQAVTGKTPAQMQAEWEEHNPPPRPVYVPPYAYIYTPAALTAPAGTSFQWDDASIIISDW